MMTTKMIISIIIQINDVNNDYENGTYIIDDNDINIYDDDDTR